MCWFLVFLFTVVFIVMRTIGKYLENKQWNNGICGESEQPWVSFDTTFSGDRLYKDNCGNYCSISYNSVDK